MVLGDLNAGHAFESLVIDEDFIWIRAGNGGRGLSGFCWELDIHGLCHVPLAH